MSLPSNIPSAIQMVEKMENMGIGFVSPNPDRGSVGDRVTSGDEFFKTRRRSAKSTVGGQRRQQQRWEKGSDMATGGFFQSDICRIKGEFGPSTLRGAKADLIILGRTIIDRGKLDKLQSVYLL